MTKYLTVSETAKLIRAALKGAFVDHRFSVRSKSYAGGASITVSWVDGPVDSEVKSVVDTFSGATFDGMTDCKEYHDSMLDGEVVSFGADYVFTTRDISEGALESIKTVVESKVGCEFESCREVEAMFFEGEIRLCSGQVSNMARLARQMFGSVSLPLTKAKLSAVYF